jgi:D-glycero-alpha-D-manno-heptose 1-phosphate guanylyltransferase
MCYKYEEIVAHVTNFYEHENIYFIVENEPMGTGGAVKNFFQKNESPEVSVFNGDTYYDTPMPSAFQTSENSIACLVTRMDVNQRYGHFEIVDGVLNVKRGTPTAAIYNSDVFIGIAKLSRDLDYGKLAYPFSLEQLLIQNSSNVELIKYSGSMVDFGIPSDYLSLREKYEN